PSPDGRRTIDGGSSFLPSPACGRGVGGEGIRALADILPGILSFSPNAANKTGAGEKLDDNEDGGDGKDGDTLVGLSLASSGGGSDGRALAGLSLAIRRDTSGTGRPTVPAGLILRTTSCAKTSSRDRTCSGDSGAYG